MNTHIHFPNTVRMVSACLHLCWTQTQMINMVMGSFKTCHRSLVRTNVCVDKVQNAMHVSTCWWSMFWNGRTDVKHTSNKTNRRPLEIWSTQNELSKYLVSDFWSMIFCFVLFFSFFFFLPQTRQQKISTGQKNICTKTKIKSANFSANHLRSSYADRKCS